MLKWLIVAIIVIPGVELWGIIRMGHLIGGWPTFLAHSADRFPGRELAGSEGRKAFAEVQTHSGAAAARSRDAEWHLRPDRRIAAAPAGFFYRYRRRDDAISVDSPLLPDLDVSLAGKEIAQRFICDSAQIIGPFVAAVRHHGEKDQHSENTPA